MPCLLSLHCLQSGRRMNLKGLGCQTGFALAPLALPYKWRRAATVSRSKQYATSEASRTKIRNVCVGILKSPKVPFFPASHGRRSQLARFPTSIEYLPCPLRPQNLKQSGQKPTCSLQEKWGWGCLASLQGFTKCISLHVGFNNLPHWMRHLLATCKPLIQ